MPNFFEDIIKFIDKPIVWGEDQVFGRAKGAAVGTLINSDLNTAFLTLVTSGVSKASSLTPDEKAAVTAAISGVPGPGDVQVYVAGILSAVNSIPELSAGAKGVVSTVVDTAETLYELSTVSLTPVATASVKPVAAAATANPT